MKNILIHQDNTILQAMEKLNSIRYISRLILFVNDDDNCIIGTLSDGDVRRSLVKHADVNKKIEEICNRNYVFEFDKTDFIDLKSYRKKDIKILPILDQQKRLLRIIDLEITKAILPLECMIMAGGRGIRLSPLTDTIPKPMMILGGKPILEHNIDKLISFGIKKIYISIKYLGQQIVDYFGDGSSKGINIEYIWEEEPLGTAGALSLVNNFSADHILLMNSDLFADADFEELYIQLIQKNADMVVATIPYSVDIPYAIMELDNDLITSFKEKPKFTYYANAGIYLFKREMINLIPKNIFYDATDWVDSIISTNGKLTHSPITGYWIDIGKHDDYNKAKEIIRHLQKL
jgi:dTDP-glucose pyrophosphorylase